MARIIEAQVKSQAQRAHHDDLKHLHNGHQGEENTIIMGLLKHITLPALAIVHGWIALSTLAMANRTVVPAAFQWPERNIEGLTAYEKHAIGLIGAFHAAFFFAVVVGILYEHGHFRAILGTMELIVWALGGWDASVMDFAPKPHLVLAGLTAIALLVHLKEPGLFTKDKSIGDKKKA